MCWAARGDLLEAILTIIGYIFCESMTSGLPRVDILDEMGRVRQKVLFWESEDGRNRIQWIS
jgi:hypothetical protein